MRTRRGVSLVRASTRRVLLLPAPAQRSHAEKDALIAALTAALTARLALADERIAAQDARIAALAARLSQQTRPPKTPGNSSKPPSQGQKPDFPAPGADRPPPSPTRKGCASPPLGEGAYRRFAHFSEGGRSGTRRIAGA
jgi:hypothetical protein